jgi:hypothetical protein
MFWDTARLANTEQLAADDADQPFKKCLAFMRIAGELIAHQRLFFANDRRNPNTRNPRLDSQRYPRAPIPYPFSPTPYPLPPFPFSPNPHPFSHFLTLAG